MKIEKSTIEVLLPSNLNKIPVSRIYLYFFALVCLALGGFTAHTPFLVAEQLFHVERNGRVKVLCSLEAK